MHKVVSIVNLKGGVGKTTTAVNVAACWAEMGKKVLLIDMDPQGSASISVGVTSEGKELHDAFKRTVALPAVATEMPGLYLVPSGMALATVDLWYSQYAGKDLLVRCLSRTEGNWDYVIIDCPPSLGFHTMNSLMACQYVIIPVETSFLALNGLKETVSVIESLKTGNQGIQIEGIIPCRAHRRRRIHWDIMDTLKEMFP